MSKQRMINTKFWSDGFIIELNPLDRYLFLYLLTNEHTNICGVYELPIRIMAFETGIDKEMLPKMLVRIKEKIKYIDGWVYIINFTKHQSPSDSVKQGIIRCLEELPEGIRQKIDKVGTPAPHLPHKGVNLTKPNLTKLNPTKLKREDTPSLIAKDFFSQGKYWDIYTELFSAGNDKDAVVEEFKKFSFYWTEKNKSGTKERWEQQNTFEVKRRLLTWFSRIKSFNKEKSGGKTISFTT